jgi:ABC-type long-subunit fatty acid transport system fused permease/ATPase subunit
MVSDNAVLTLFVILVLVTVAILDGIWTTTEKNEMRTRSLLYSAMTAFTDQYSDQGCVQHRSC